MDGVRELRLRSSLENFPGASSQVLGTPCGINGPVLHCTHPVLGKTAVFSGNGFPLTMSNGLRLTLGD